MRRIRLSRLRMSMVVPGQRQQIVARIPSFADGMVGLWDDSWLAAQRAMAYSVEALTRTRKIDFFLRAVRPQAAFTRLIGDEVDELTGGELPGYREYNRGLEPNARRTIMRWHHDRYASKAVTLFGIAELAKHMPSLNASWYERARRIYAVNPSLSNIVNGAVDAHVDTLRQRGILIDVDVDGGDIFFVNKVVLQLATDIITNLISNAVKYSEDGGAIRVKFRRGEFSVEDEGIGMDVPFAQLLGQDDPIREMRATGVKGFGFGWMTIGRALNKLGWRRAVETEPNVGSKFTVTMQAKHLISRRRVKPVAFDEMALFETLAQGNEILNGARPLAGYHVLASDHFDASESAAAWVIQAVGKIDAQFTQCAAPN